MLQAAERAANTAQQEAATAAAACCAQEPVVGLHPGSRQAPAGAMQPADLNQQPPHTPAAGLQVKPTSKPHPPADRALIRPSSGVTAKLRGEVGFSPLACLPDGHTHNACTLLHGGDGMLVEVRRTDLQQPCRSAFNGPGVADAIHRHAHRSTRQRCQTPAVPTARRSSSCA
jgi:hypothetical protein